MEETMSQWAVEIVIGRLLTDEVFRRHLEQRGQEWLAIVREYGIDLDDAEIEALSAADVQIWTRLATSIDRRLHRRQNARVDVVASLTARQRHVLRGVFQGMTNKQIAADVGVTEPAVKATLQQLFRKTRVRTRAQLVRVAVQGGLGLSDGRRR
jgi:DNA-binding NarL/FixJ family response regulator